MTRSPVIPAPAGIQSDRAGHTAGCGAWGPPPFGIFGMLAPYAHLP